MNKFGIILRHTYGTHIRSKSFIISTIITLLIVVGLTNFQNIMNMFGDGEDSGDRVAVISDSEPIFNQLQQSLNAVNEDADIVQFNGTSEEAQAAVKEEEFDYFVHVQLNENNNLAATYYAMEISNSGFVDTLQQSLGQIKTGLIAAEANLDQETIQQFYAPVPIEKVALEESAKTEEELSSARGLVYFMLFLIYFAVMMYGNMIATEVANEKSSRVMEIIVSSVSPIVQMFGKITGIALLGLTQFAVIIGVSYVSITANQDSMVGGMFEYFGLSNISISTLFYGLLFFILGYLLYAMLAAMLGSLVSRTEEVQQAVTPMIFMVVIAFLIAMYGLNDPTSSVVTITSYIPFFTPIIMFMRVGMIDVPIWEVALSIGLLVITILIMAQLAARVYRGGVLMYGRSSSWKDIKKALQLTKKE
ncbi:ABC transporter permease [Salirhabdus sp. Marseille-P4669]|uniref:ABC transporter permease n=1 Tax=Salirhabdus sp. Marseille-P4669 TaxID=2042310 RepID=UPI000C79591D|nr:ABC transporter permease [Salirhabdus sp. Marseille-P4669]